MSFRTIHMKVKIDLFWSFLPGYNQFTGISNIINDYILYVKGSTCREKHD